MTCKSIRCIIFQCKEAIIISISNSVKALLSITDKKQSDLMPVLNMGSKQSMSNKISFDRWTGDDLAKVADFCNAQLAFIVDDQKIIIKSDSKKAEE